MEDSNKDSREVGKTARRFLQCLQESILDTIPGVRTNDDEPVRMRSGIKQLKNGRVRHYHS